MVMTQGTVTVPGLGPVQKKWVVIGGGGTVLILGVMWYRHRTAAAAAPAATDPNAVDPTIDPATRIPYADEAAGVAAGTMAGYGTSGLADTSGIVGYDAQGNPVYSDQVGYGPTPSFVSNAAWAQATQQYLVSTTGADAGTVAAALGTYLNGQPLTEAQASVVQSAIAFFGSPPQSGSNGYPPALKMAAPQTGGTGGGTGGGGGGGTGTGSTVTGGHVISVSNAHAVVGWTHTGPATQWQVKIIGPGGNNGHVNTVSIPQATYGGLQAGHNYEVYVTPWADGAAAGPTGMIHFMTKK